MSKQKEDVDEIGSFQLASTFINGKDRILLLREQNSADLTRLKSY